MAAGAEFVDLGKRTAIVAKQGEGCTVDVEGYKGERGFFNPIASAEDNVDGGRFTAFNDDGPIAAAFVTSNGNPGVVVGTGFQFNFGILVVIFTVDGQDSAADVD